MENKLFVFFIVALCLNFCIETFLDILNLRFQTGKIPRILNKYIQPDEYKKSISYEKENAINSLLLSSKTFLITLIFLIFSGFKYLNEIAYSISHQPIIHSLIFFGIIVVFMSLLSLPFSLYSTFVIEEKYGFNKTTLKLYIADQIKSSILSVLFGGGILALIQYFYMQSPEWFWLFAWFVLIVIMVFFMLFYSNLIVPLFNKQIPLEEGELRTKINEFAINTGFSLSNIYVINGSLRSTKANAYFTGMGPKKRIVLYDTLIQQNSQEQLIAVLAHEIGHYKHKHTTKSMISAFIQSGIYLYLLSIFLNPENPIAIAAAHALGTVPSFHISLLSFGLLLSPLELFLGPIMNYFSRKNEFQADAFAVKHTSSKDLGEALINLSKNHLSKLEPHPWYVFFHYSHPSLMQRLQKIKFKND